MATEKGKVLGHILGVTFDYLFATDEQEVKKWKQYHQNR